jgi:primosomal protein N' (replication factor Y) (superfamily II helicase)
LETIIGSMQQPVTVEVLLPYALGTPYTYVVPPTMSVAPGSYVVVPLASREVIGVVWQTTDAALSPEKAPKLRGISHVLPHPPMGDLQRRFIDWLARYYVVPAGMVLRMALRVPAALDEARNRIAYQVSGRLPAKMTRARKRVLEALKDMPPLRPSEIAELAGVGPSVVKGLAAEGVIEAVTLPGFQRFDAPDLMRSGKTLSASQQQAAESLVAAAREATHSVTLIDGITGSGKTEVYFEAMAAALAKGKQVLLLVPEIALTAQFIDRVEDRFAARPAEWHSDVRPRERERVWRGVASGEVKVLVGARSALFLPWQNLGLIVVDEEHEGAFKQEDGVTYHARDMAVVYGALGGFPVVLSSATPSLESLVNVDRGRYGRVVLPDRIGRAGLPEIRLIDMREAALPAGEWISEELRQAVDATLAQGEQALLFLNRRGYAPLTICRACGYRIECPHCSAALVEHRFRRVMLCHHCGHQQPSLHRCPDCGSEGHLVPCGPGVERLAEEVRRRFPDARSTILSSDLVRGATLKDTLRDVKEGKFNIIIGTQLVAKGHHFPDLTLVGIIDADLALETSDPRAGERTFQLLRQVSGRAGRGDRQGLALIQTFNPDHPLMAALHRGDMESFIAQEKSLRERALLPPYGQLAGVIVSGAEAAETEQLARQVARIAPLADDVELLGPAPAPLAVIKGRHRWRLLVRTRRNVNIQGFVRRWLQDLKPAGSLRVDVDIDPYQFL